MGAGPLPDLARLFLRLGFTAFGGPAAHVAMMQQEVVARRGWLTDEEFLDLLGATNLIPGPNSTEMAMHIGQRRGGGLGLLVAGLCFILPAATVTGILAGLYVRYGTVPEAGWLLYGVKPVIVAIVVHAGWSLARKAASNLRLAAIGLTAVAAVAAGMEELLVLLLAGVAAMASSGLAGRVGAALLLLAPQGAAAGGAAAGASVTLPGLFLLFLKVGSVLFGSGYVLLAFLRADLVGRLGWLTEAQLLDAVAIGQITPGPVSSTATFVGYLLLGPPGAVVATVGIFLPAFFFVAISGPLVPRLRRSRRAGDFLDGVNVASLALLAVVSAQLGRAAIGDVPTLLLAAVSFFLLLRFRLNAMWLVLGGAAMGLLLGRR